MKFTATLIQGLDWSWIKLAGKSIIHLNDHKWSGCGLFLDVDKKLEDFML